MKNLTYLIYILLTICYISCNDETIEMINYSENKSLNTDLEKNEYISNTPCNFDLSQVLPNTTVNIDCTIDLDNTTINLPDNVNFDFNNGKITNGTLIFKGGYIDGRLLNSKLIVKNSSLTEKKVILKDSTFKFIASKWDIVQGSTTDEIAKKNKDILQDLINKIKSMQGSTFSINILDAYFKVDVPLEINVPQDAAITLPSDFNFVMTNNTHLRMQPNSFKQPTLLSVTNGNSNVTIEGGNLHGDRDEHDYSDGGTHEWGHLLRLKACSFVTVKNVTFMDASGDGVDVSALGHSFSPNYTPSHDLLITNNVFMRNRRNNLSITDGYDIIVENNEFIDAGIHTSYSTGTPPSYAIDVEAYRTSDVIYEIVEDVIIRNNSEKGSRVGGFTVHTGDRVTIEGNTMENSISYSTSIGSIIKNNTITSTSDRTSSYVAAITAGRNDRFERNYNNRVYGNTITGFSTGMKMANTDLHIYNNIIKDCKVGMSIETLTNSKIYNNEIKSTRDSSDGIATAPLAKYINNLKINNNTIDVKRTPFKFVGVNSYNEDYRFTFENNSINSINTSTMSNSKGFIFVGNNIKEGGIRLVNAKNGLIYNNIITSTASDGIELNHGNANINIYRNRIDVIENFRCIKNLATDGVNINIGKNICF